MDQKQEATPLVDTSQTTAHLFADRKIVFLYASSGRGHKAAAVAIREALQDQGFAGRILIVDILQYMPRLMADIFSKGYIYAASKLPWLWYALYERRSRLDEFTAPSPWQEAFWRMTLRRLTRWLIAQHPDYIISTYFTASWAAGRYKSLHHPACRVATVVTDYGMHPAWLAPAQDRYFVATEETKYELEVFSWYTSTPAEMIDVVGIPIDRRFYQAKDKQELKARYGLKQDRFTVLVLAGAYGTDHVEKIATRLLRCRSPLQLFLVAAKDFILGPWLREQLAQKGIIFRTYGLIDFLPDLVAMSDIAVTKSGGLSSTECLVSGCPLLVYKPYPGQEERNCTIFLERGAARRIHQLESLPFIIDSIASNQKRYQAMVEAARSFGKFPAADAIAMRVIADMKGDEIKAGQSKAHSQSLTLEKKPEHD